MPRFAESLYTLCISLWVGGTLTIGYLVVPILFHQINDRALAGQVAGELFAVMSWSGIACGFYTLVFLGIRERFGILTSRVFWIVLAMLTLVLAGHFGVQPILAQLKQDALPHLVMESALRDRFAVWHGVSSTLFLIQSILGVLLVMWQRHEQPAP